MRYIIENVFFFFSSIKWSIALLISAGQWPHNNSDTGICRWKSESLCLSPDPVPNY